MNPPPRFPIARLVLVGFVAPVILSIVDRWLLDHLAVRSSDTRLFLFVMLVFVVQVGLLGWLCGRLLDHPWWCWGLFLWSSLLIDLQALTATGYSSAWWYPQVLPHFLFAAQVGWILIWAILGTTNWMIRLPACAVIGTILAVPLQSSHGFTAELLCVQLIAVAVLCAGLRLRGYRLQNVAVQSSDSRTAGAENTKRPSVQFNIRHVLFWTTSLAVLLGVLRALDLLSLTALRDLFPQFGRSVITPLSAGVVIALAYVIVLWAALGMGSVWARVAVLLLTLPAVGLLFAILHFHDDRIRHQYMFPPPFWQELLRGDIWYSVWVILAGSLLFALLIIFRARGYRLVQNVRPRPVVAVDGALELT